MTTPIHDFTAETHLLGTLMYDDKHFAAIPPRLTPSSFFSSTNGHIFQAMLDLRAKQADIDVESVLLQINANGRHSQLPDGVHHLINMTNVAPAMSPKTFDTLAATIVNKATQRALQLVLGRALARASDPTLDVSSELGDLEKQVLDLSLNVLDANAGLVQVGDALRTEVAEWMRRSQAGEPPGIPTGFAVLDQTCGGLHGGELVVLGARPGMGKTSMVTGLAVNVAKRGLATAIFSLEMPTGQLASRMLCSESGLRLNRVRAGQFEPKELTDARVALETLKNLGIYIDDAAKGRPYVSDIVARSRRLAAELKRQGKRLALVVVDYIQIVKLSADLQKQRHDLAIGEVSIELKSLAKELGCTVVACAQLNRGVQTRDDKRPGMADLRDSGQIEQDADQVLMLYRDEYYNPETRDRGVVEVLVEKNRHGRTGTVMLRFDGPTMTFYDDPSLNMAQRGDQ